VDYNYEDYEDDWTEEGDEQASAAPAEVPPDMKLTVEVGLTQYTPNGLLGLIAAAMVKDVGGADKWRARFRKMLADEGRSKLRGLIDAEAALLFEGQRDALREEIRKAFDSYFAQRVDVHGNPLDSNSYGFRDAKDTRISFLVRQLAAEAVEKAWKEIEAETKAQWTANIKAIVTELVAAKVERVLPAPKMGQG
jgi:hypothetical protein